MNETQQLMHLLQQAHQLSLSAVRICDQANRIDLKTYFYDMSKYLEGQLQVLEIVQNSLLKDPE